MSKAREEYNKEVEFKPVYISRIKSENYIKELENFIRKFLEEKGDCEDCDPEQGFCDECLIYIANDILGIQMKKS